MTSLGSRGVTEDVELPKELTPVTSHSIAFVDPYFALIAPKLNRVNTCILAQVDLKRRLPQSGTLAFCRGKESSLVARRARNRSGNQPQGA